MILRFSDCIFPRFIVALIGSPLVRQYLGGSSVGATMQNLNQSILLSLIIGLPPLAEQRRIVAKVDELMALCDRLEAARKERESRRDRLVAASLHRLIKPADDAEPFRAGARFIFNHLPRLTTRPDHVKQLRQTILNLAIRGRLVPQDPNDEPAIEMLHRIHGNKQLLRIADAEGKPDSIIADDLSFPIPTSWTWVRLAELLESSFYGPRFASHAYTSGGVPTIRTTDMTSDGRIALRDPPRVEVDAERLSDFRCLDGDLLVTRTGTIGKMAIFRGHDLAIPSA
jgi:type I restriction enzyme S subunit